MRSIIGFALVMLVTFLHIPTSGKDDLATADSLFERRNEMFDANTLLADSTIINAAIQLYQNIVDKSSDTNLKKQALVKFLQAYYFKGLFATKDIRLRRKIYATGIEIGEHHLTEFSQSVEMNCWLGILWGYRGEVNGMVTSARKGVPGKVRFYAEKTVALDSCYLDGGGFRMLGRLNYKVPKIPPFLNWSSKKKALYWLEKAYAVAPQNWYNKLYLAEVLASQSKVEQAATLLQEITHTSGVHHDVAIDAYLRNQAMHLLQKLRR